MRFFCNFFYKNRINIQVTYAHTHTSERERESRRASGKEWRRDTHALVQLLRGLGWAAGLPRPWTIYQMLLLTLRTSGGKLRHCLASFPTNSSGHFLWHAQDAHVHFPLSPSHSLSLSHSVCVRVCVFADRFQIWTALCFMCMKCGRCSELVHGPKNDAVRCQDNARSALVESVPMVGN